MERGLLPVGLFLLSQMFIFFFTEQIRSFPDGLSEVFFPRLQAENKLEVCRKGHPHLSKKHIFIIKRGKVQPHTKSSSLNTSHICESQVVLKFEECQKQLQENKPRFLSFSLSRVLIFTALAEGYTALICRQQQEENVFTPLIAS